MCVFATFNPSFYLSVHIQHNPRLCRFFLQIDASRVVTTVLYMGNTFVMQSTRRTSYRSSTGQPPVVSIGSRSLTYHRALREISNTRRPSPRSSLSSGASTYLPVSTSVHNTFTKAYLCTLIAVACGAASPGRAVRCADPLVHGSNNMLVQARLMPSVFHARHLGGRLANNIRRQTTN